MDNSQLRIGQLADMVGVTPKTIRHYHKIGLLPRPQRSANNYRQYNFTDLYRLKLILRLKAVGFSLANIRSIIQADDPDAALHQRLHELNQQLTNQIQQLEQQQHRVQALLVEGVTLGDIDRPDSRSSMTYRLLTDVLEGYMIGSSADVKALDQALLAHLDMFNWGEEYQDYWLQLAHSLADNVEHLNAAGEQIAAAARLTADDPQLEQIADEVAEQLQPLHMLIAVPELKQPLQDIFKQVAVRAIQETLTPAQEHLIGLIRLRLYK